MGKSVVIYLLLLQGNSDIHVSIFVIIKTGCSTNIKDRYIFYMLVHFSIICVIRIPHDNFID